jgi:hypothetical protein
MCPGGPNHCRVGRAGSQSYFCQLIVVLASRCLMCVLVCYVVVAVACVMFVVMLRRRVECLYYPCTHAHTHKKKKKKKKSHLL